MTNTRISLIEPATAEGPAKELLGQVQSAFGMVPNLTKAFAASPAVLEGFLALSGALSKTGFSASERELIAITVGQANGCEYCLSAHTKIGEMMGSTPSELALARTGRSETPRIQAAQQLAISALNTKGNVSDTDFESARNAGLSEGEIMEVAALTVLNIYTNYLNHVAQTPNDWPLVQVKEVANA